MIFTRRERGQPDMQVIVGKVLPVHELIDGAGIRSIARQHINIGWES